MADSTPDILLSFLRTPLTGAAFAAFFDLSYRRTIAYLRILRSRGYRLPLDDRTDADPIADLAIDVLGEIMAPVKGQLCPGLFAYLQRQGYREFCDEDALRLEILYVAFLRRQIRQRLSHLRTEVHPQTENLKRRVRDVLRELGYTEPSPSGSLVGPPLAQDAEEPARPMIPAGELHRLVQEAFLSTTTRKAWCTEIFRRLAAIPDYHPRLPLPGLLAAIVEVNTRFLESEEFGPGGYPGPEEEYARRELAGAVQAAVAQTCQGTLRRFVEEGRLTPAEGECVRLALERYLGDVSAGGDTDKIPAYFRETMPPETHERYLTDYKYVFETILAEGRQRLRDYWEEVRH